MKKIQRQNVSEAVYSAVKQVLLTNKYSPGERIGIEELCQELEVSRTPVFEALNRLKAEGMVEIIPRKGVYLVSFSVEKAKELYIVREALEGMATKLAAEKLTPRYANLLKASLDEQAACLQKDDIKGYATATIDFHNIILKAADNDTLSRNLGAIYAQIEALQARTDQYLEAVKRGDQVAGDFYDALRNMRVVNTTINQEVRRETEKLVYTDCRLPDSGADLLGRKVDAVNMRLIGKGKK